MSLLFATKSDGVLSNNKTTLSRSRQLTPVDSMHTGLSNYVGANAGTQRTVSGNVRNQNLNTQKVNPFIPTVPYPGHITGFVSLFFEEGLPLFKEEVFEYFFLSLFVGDNRLQGREGLLLQGIWC